jgi:hypothetical protein
LGGVWSLWRPIAARDLQRKRLRGVNTGRGRQDGRACAAGVSAARAGGWRAVEGGWVWRMRGLSGKP